MQYRYYFYNFDKAACLIEHVLPRHVEEKAGQRHLNTVLQTLAKIFRPTFHAEKLPLAKIFRCPNVNNSLQESKLILSSLPRNQRSDKQKFLLKSIK
jgi:hypothetical protein